MKPINKLITILAFSALLPISASATTLSGNLTADDAFTAYLELTQKV